jgi:outer membrane protein TolC
MKKFVAFVIPAILFSSEAELLKSSKRELLENKRQEAEIKGELIKNSWWGGINIDGSYNFTYMNGRSDNAPSVTVSVSQDLFRSGGIFWQIDKGKIYKSLQGKMLNLEEREMIFSLYNLVLNIKKLDLQIEQQKLSINNQKITIKNLQDSYVNGLIDISQLDQSIIDLNTLKNIEEGLIQARIDLITSLGDLTDLEYSQIEVPSFELPTSEQFLEDSSRLEIKREEIESLDIERKLVLSQYLPKLSVYGSYTYEDSSNSFSQKDSHRYGLKLNIPISFNMGDAFEGAKITYLRANSELNDQNELQKNIYKKAVSKLQSIDRRVKNSEELIESYQNIYKITEDYFKSNLKTEDDVTLMKNRLTISQFDLKIYRVDREIILLNLVRELNKD